MGEYPYLCRVEFMYPVFTRSSDDGDTLEWTGGYLFLPGGISIGCVCLLELCAGGGLLWAIQHFC